MHSPFGSVGAGGARATGGTTAGTVGMWVQGAGLVQLQLLAPELIGTALGLQESALELQREGVLGPLEQQGELLVQVLDLVLQGRGEVLCAPLKPGH